MPIEDRDLKSGTRLAARYKGKEYAAEVVQTEDGTRYRLKDGREFKSPSSAGSVVMGDAACNGWRFWSVSGSEEAKSKRAAKKSGKGKAKANPGNGSVSRLEDGRYFCGACMEPFEAPAELEPQGYPTRSVAEYTRRPSTCCIGSFSPIRSSEATSCALQGQPEPQHESS